MANEIYWIILPLLFSELVSHSQGLSSKLNKEMCFFLMRIIIKSVGFVLVCWNCCQRYGQYLNDPKVQMTL